MPPSTNNKRFFRLSPINVELEEYSPRYPQEMRPLGLLARPPVYLADLLSRRFRGGSAIRLSLGEQLVGLLQVVKRTNTPLIP